MRRLASSAAVIERGKGNAWLIDVSPDLPAQLEMVHEALRQWSGSGFPVKEVLLTHAHMGHYWGLGYLGKEGIMARNLAVAGTPRMIKFLKKNRPFKDMIDWGVLVPSIISPGEPVHLSAELTATAHRVPHREDFTDTVAWVLEGPNASILYAPDLDKLDKATEGLIAEVDIALVDGTFFREDEIGQGMRVVPHPPVEKTLPRLSKTDMKGTRVIYIHLNHTNPMCDPSSPEAEEVRKKRLEVAEDGMTFDL
jgi:pyrroloquinoline quinone biosynthesis protein B